MKCLTYLTYLTHLLLPSWCLDFLLPRHLRLHPRTPSATDRLTAVLSLDTILSPSPRVLSTLPSLFRARFRVRGATVEISSSIPKCDSYYDRYRGATLVCPQTQARVYTHLLSRSCCLFRPDFISCDDRRGRGRRRRRPRRQA